MSVIVWISPREPDQCVNLKSLFSLETVHRDQTDVVVASHRDGSGVRIFDPVTRSDPTRSIA